MQSRFFKPEVEVLETRALPAVSSKPLPLLSPAATAYRAQVPVRRPIVQLLKKMRLNVDSESYDKFLIEVSGAMKRTAADSLQKDFRDSCQWLLRLLKAKSTFVNQTDREQLVFETMYYIANPEKVDQGFHPTCVPTAFASVLFMDRPATASRLLCESVKNGWFVSPADGAKVPVTRSSYVSPCQHESTLRVPEDGERTFAVQLMNTLFMNDIGRQPNKFVTINDTAFRTSMPLLYVTDPTGKNDYWSDYSGSYVTTFNGAYAPDFSVVGRMWCGDCVLYDQDYYPASGGARNFGSLEGFEQQLTQLIAVNHNAVTLVVSGTEIVQQFRNPTVNVESQQNHLVSVTQYDPVGRIAFLNNQWGAHYDRWVSVELLYDFAVYTVAA